MKIEKIAWVDNSIMFDNDKWHEINKLKDIPETVHLTTGFVVFESEKQICLAMTVNDNQMFTGQYICKSSIVDRMVIYDSESSEKKDVVAVELEPVDIPDQKVKIENPIKNELSEEEKQHRIKISQAFDKFNQIKMDHKIPKDSYIVSYDPVCTHFIAKDNKTEYFTNVHFIDSNCNPLPVNKATCKTNGIIEEVFDTAIKEDKKIVDKIEKLKKTEIETPKPKSYQPGEYFPAKSSQTKNIKLSPRENELLELEKKYPGDTRKQSEDLGCTMQTIYVMRNSIKKKQALGK